MKHISTMSLHDLFNEPFQSRHGIFMFSISAFVLLISMVNTTISTVADIVDDQIDRRTLVSIDLMTNIYFSIEWAIRFLAAPSKFDFLSSSIVILELLANLVIICDIGYLLSSNQIWIVGYIPLLCTVRCLRLCRLYWHSFQLQLAFKAVKKSMDGLLMMVLLCLISIVFLSNVMFYTETLSCELKDGTRYYTSGHKQGELCSFQTLFDAFWWAICTITTVGYGDTIPQTPQGRTIAAMVMLLAVIMFTFPITIISSHLTEVYMTAKKHKKLKKVNNHHVVNMDEHSLSISLLSQCEYDVEQINKKLMQLTYTLNEVVKHLDHLKK
eukprot:NODE_108_length_18904_cov_0.654826.p9 type:complete len:326 gc:universal NODE_108_length_18904_cov_0.654826:10287-9310(-)